MAERENHTSWEATLYMWWASSWRLGIAVFVFDAVTDKLLSSIHGQTIGIDFLILLVLGLCRWWISLWAVRASLTDRYSTFTPVVESKATGESLFGFDKKLGMNIVIRIWWARTWRVFLVPVAILLGTVGAAVLSHESVLNAIHTLRTSKGELFTALLMFPVSLWATRESFADKYRFFLIRTLPKTVSP